MIVTVVDRFSKMCSLVLLCSTTAPAVAAAFFRNVVAHHGLPCQLLSDHDPHFTSEFWTCLMCALKMKVAYSTAFHPQTDGMAKVSNRTLGQLLCLHCKENRWIKDLPLLSLLYNATPQS